MNDKVSTCLLYYIIIILHLFINLLQKQETCHNFVRVLLLQKNNEVFVCGTNAFHPTCTWRPVSIYLCIYLYTYVCMYIYVYIPLLTSIDVAPLMKTTGVVENSGHCIYCIGLKCFLNCLSLFHLVIYLLQSNTRIS